MRNAETVLAVIQDRGKRGLPVTDLYRQLYNPDLYLKGYGRLAKNKRAMTKGATSETVDGMSMTVIQELTAALRYERFRWTPIRRTYIPKRNGKKRPLGISGWTDKLLQEGIGALLEAYYEPQFSPHSHGFRPGCGCHTALEEIRQGWAGVTWLIEGDIKGCLDAINHEVLLAMLGEQIQDGRFLNLIKRLLQVGYMENWRYNATYSGTPQGGVISPLLSNIYLDRLDRFVDQELKPAFTRGERRKNPEYHRVTERYRHHRKRGNVKEAKALAKYLRTLPSKMTHDPEYRRLYYVRYADDFLIGFVGPRSEAEEIKRRVAAFLADRLKLEMSAEKTLITQARTQAARFLGYDISTHQADEKQTSKRRSANGRIGLKLPDDVLRKKRQEYMKEGKPSHRSELIGESDFTIVGRYSQVLDGFANYYSLAVNRAKLWKLASTMRHSLTATLAAKHKTSRRDIVKRYTGEVATADGLKRAIVVTVEREGKRPLQVHFGAHNFRRQPEALIVDELPKRQAGRTTLEQRLLASQCELCGATDKIEVHHIRRLADLKKPGRAERPAWVVRMAEIQRKTLVVCSTCHDDIHAGRPTRRKGERQDDWT